MCGLSDMDGEGGKEDRHPLDLGFVSRDGLVPALMLRGHLGPSNHELIVTLFLGEGWVLAELPPYTSGGQTVFRRPVVRVPWEAVLKGKGVQEHWTFFKKEILEVYKQTVPTCQKTSQRVYMASHQSPLGSTPEGQRGPGRLDILQKRKS